MVDIDVDICRYIELAIGVYEATKTLGEPPNRVDVLL